MRHCSHCNSIAPTISLLGREVCQQSYGSIKNAARMRSQKEVLLEDHYTLNNDRWSSICVIAGLPLYVRIRYQDYFPMKLAIKCGVGDCVVYISKSSIHPNPNNSLVILNFKLRGTKIVRKAGIIEDYIYMSIVSNISTCVNIKVWFESDPQFIQNVDKKFKTIEGEAPRSYSMMNNKHNIYSQRYRTHTIDHISINRDMSQYQNRVSPLAINNTSDKIKLVQHRRIESYYMKMVHQQSKLILKQYHKNIRAPKLTQQWLVILTFHELIDLIFRFYKINRVLKFMKQVKQIYVLRWRSMYLRQRISPILPERVLINCQNVVHMYCLSTATEIRGKAESVIKWTITNYSNMLIKAQFENKTYRFIRQVKYIQKYIRNHFRRIKYLIQQMIVQYQRLNNVPLISKKKKQLITNTFYLLKFKIFKQQYEQYMNQEQNGNTLITAVFAMKKPKLRLTVAQSQLHDIIKSIL